MADVTVAAGDTYLDGEVIGQLTTYSVEEAATPLVPGDTNGATSQVTVTGVEGRRAYLASGSDLLLDLGDSNLARGTISSIESAKAPGLVTLKADSLINRLNVEVQAAPYYRSIGDLAADNFNRPNSSTTLGAPWTTLGGVLGIIDGQAYSVSNSLGAASINVGTPNHRAAATITSTGPLNYAGVLVRGTDYNNYYYADYGTGGVWRLYKKVAGVSTQLATGDGFIIGDQIALSIYGNRLTLFKNGSPIHTRTDSAITSGNLSGLSYGGFSTSTANKWEDFSVTSLDANGVQTGTLANAVLGYARLAGIDVSQLLIDSEIALDPVVFPGFVGNLWDHIKQMCAAWNYQVYSTGDKIGITKPGKILLEILEPTSTTLTVDATVRAQRVEINNYDLRGTDQGIFFKAEEVYSLDADEEQEIKVTIEGTPYLVNNPICVDGMDLEVKDGLGQYVVTGGDGWIVAPAFWNDNGGKVTVRVSTENADELIITIKAPADASRAPYRISEGEDRAALWITGAGVLSTVEVVQIYTGDADASEKIMDVVDNKFIKDRDMAFTAGNRLAQTYAAPSVTLSISGIPDLALSQKLNGADIDMWFGSLAGSILTYGDSKYRVITATYAPEGVSLDLTRHVTFEDFNTIWAGKTFEQYQNAVGTQITFAQAAVQPLATA